LFDGVSTQEIKSLFSARCTGVNMASLSITTAAVFFLIAALQHLSPAVGFLFPDLKFRPDVRSAGKKVGSNRRISSAGDKIQTQASRDLT
jgi:hypothetical protein